MTNKEIEKRASVYNDNWSKQGFIAGSKWMQKLAIKEINKLKCINKQLALRVKTLEREVK